uniref:Uncharacterized protein n=1 Tax=Triticum urartu TaxID=4572 RepID=A0A8R7NYN1_TRIUA
VVSEPLYSSVLERKPKPDPDAGLTPAPLPHRARATPCRRSLWPPSKPVLAVGLPARASRSCSVCASPTPAADLRRLRLTPSTTPPQLCSLQPAARRSR